MDGMTTGGKLLGQDDIDALLSEAGLEGDYEAKPQEDEPLEQPKPAFKNEERSERDIHLLIELLCKKACLNRDEGIQIIWNASSVFPMAADLKLKIQGVEYTSLGVLNDDHLVVTTAQ